MGVEIELLDRRSLLEERIFFDALRYQASVAIRRA